MNKIITNVVSIRLRKLNARYRLLYDEIHRLKRVRQDNELTLLQLDRQIFDLNRALDKLEEEILEDLST